VGFSDVAAKPAWHRVYGINDGLCRVDGAWASLGVRDGKIASLAIVFNQPADY